jgi:3-keto-disaccharide hydrolase
MTRSISTVRMVRTALIGLAISGACIAADNQKAPDGFKPIFDGKTLEGWEGNHDWFRVQDGAIVGGTLDKKIPRNEFLCTEKDYGDFELRLKVKLVDGKGNGGVQLRSRRIPNDSEVIGYQADMGEGWWGGLYDESRRRKVLAKPDAKKLAEILKPNDWNDYRIRCQGRHIQLWLNGYQTVDYTEPDEKLEQKGIIGVQIHAGDPSETWYKDIVIKELK